MVQGKETLLFDPALPPDSPAVTDEVIGIARCLGQHGYDLDRLRAAAQLLNSVPREGGGGSASSEAHSGAKLAKGDDRSSFAEALQRRLTPAATPNSVAANVSSR
jgi:hypothetical protein